MAVLLVVMIALGGAVRLTDSGLSITQWELISGVIPPLSLQEWQNAFTQYQGVPQYKAIHSTMTLADFKTIYWWEWTHRFFGRFLGFAFLFPFLFFVARGFLSARMIRHCLVIFALGALQGVLGWFMVVSGLSERVDVAPMRLALHFGLALVIYGWVVLLILSLKDRWINKPHPLLIGLAILVFTQSILGSFVAAMDAGLAYNDWLWPWGADLTARMDNPFFWQMAHRLGGWFLVIWAGLALYLYKGEDRQVLAIFCLLLLGQLMIGLLTLIHLVPLSLGLIHQFGAVLLWSLALFLLTIPKNKG